MSNTRFILEGICPYCNHDKLEILWDDVDIENKFIHTDYSCKQCTETFQACYTIKFRGYELVGSRFFPADHEVTKEEIYNT